MRGTRLLRLCCVPAALALLFAPGSPACAQPTASGTEQAVSGTGRTGFAIQAGAFSRERHAEALTERLRSRGVQAAYARKEGGLFAVYSGDFTSRESARKSARKLVSAGVINAFYIISLKELATGAPHVVPESGKGPAAAVPGVSVPVPAKDGPKLTRQLPATEKAPQQPPVPTGPVQAAEKGARLDARRLVPYDKELYETGYAVFMANGNLGDALLVAEAAVSQRPGDATWRQRAARTAEWSSQPGKALDHWFVLAVEHRDPEGLKRALALAEGVGDHARRLVLLQLRLKQGADEKLLKEFVEACEMTGEPEKAIAVLSQYKPGRHRVHVLSELARLYRTTGKTGQAIAAYRELAETSKLSSFQRLTLATLQYGTRDLDGAYRGLLAGAEEFGADQEYQETLSDVCWAVQDVPCAGSASERLLRERHARDVDYQRIIHRYRDGEPEKALRVARQGWEASGKAVFFFSAAEILRRMGNDRQLTPLFEGLTNEQQASLSSSAYYWTLRSQAYRLAGNINESIQSHRRAMALEPGNEGLMAGYLWLLLDLDREEDVREFILRHAGRKRPSAELVDAFGAAYAYSGDFKTALGLMRSRYSHYRGDPAWLAGYADVLEQNGQQEAAFQERLKGLAITQSHMKGADLGSDAARRLLIDHVRHALRVSGDRRLDDIMAFLASGKQDDVTRELVSAWALATERSELARLWLWRAYALNAVRPDWVRLGLALEANDRDAIAALLNRRLQRLPYRDAIEGAQRVGQTPLAEELSFEKSLQNPDDQQLYKQLRELYGERPSLVRNRFRIWDRGGVAGQEDAFTVSAPMSRRYAIFADLEEQSVLSRKQSSIAASPARDLSALLGVSGRYERLRLSAAAGARTALETFPRARLTGQYGITSRDSATLELNYGGRAEEGVPINLAGMKHEAALSASHAFDGHTVLQMRFAVSSLLDQGGARLGDARSYSADLSRSLTLDYPDCSLRIFGGYFEYGRKGVPFDKALAFVPEGSPRDASFFVPESFLQAGLGASFGMRDRDRYGKEWKPFGNADIIWNSVSHVGYRYELGFRGPLLGYDILFFGVSQESGAFGSSSQNSMIETGYTWLFN